MRVSLLCAVLVVVFLSTPRLTDAGEVCIVPSKLTGSNLSVDCDTICFDCPGRWAYDNATVGYSTTGAPCATGACPDPLVYGWSISASSTDPNVNSGALPAPTASLYLWFRCDALGGFSAAEFDLETTGSDLVHLSTDMLNDVLNAGTFNQPLIAVGGCPEANFLVARLNMMVLPVSVESETWSNVKEMYR